MIDNTFILLICVVVGTYMLRIGGVIFAGYVSDDPRTRAFLSALPATMLIALIFPLLIEFGPTGWMALFVVLCMMLVSRNPILSATLGVISMALLRTL